MTQNNKAFMSEAPLPPWFSLHAKSHNAPHRAWQVLVLAVPVQDVQGLNQATVLACAAHPVAVLQPPVQV
jgi:hypothetical protein